MVVIDDDSTWAERMCALLAEHGFVGIHVSRRKQALAIVEREAVAAVILEAHLRSAGILYPFISQIARMGSQIQIVVVTQFASSAGCTYAFERGAVQYLAKPSGKQDWLTEEERLVDAVAGRSRARLWEMYDAPLPVAPRMSLAEIDWEVAWSILCVHGWKTVPAAIQLGVSRSALSRLLVNPPR